jgi:hypothetical protein
MFAAGDTAKMFEAYPRQTGNFFLGEDLLIRFDGDHRMSTIHPLEVVARACGTSDVSFAVKASFRDKPTCLRCNIRAVSLPTNFHFITSL